MPPEQIMEGCKGEKSRAVRMYDLEQRRLIDAEITRRSIAFMEGRTQANRPFFAFAALTQPLLPTLPNPAFAGKTGNGDWADMLAEMDHNVGQMIDAIDRLGIRDNTIVIFAISTWQMQRPPAPRVQTASLWIPFCCRISHFTTARNVRAGA